jgi:hypothetical protein
MRQILTTKSAGKISIKPNAKGGYQKIMRNKIAGYGVGEEVYDNLDKGKKTAIQHLSQKQTNLSVKPSKQRKYISLNL